MSDKNLPRVIVTCIDAWRNDVGANTLPNFFSDWDADKLAVIYTKSDLPDCEYSNSYFQISENDLVHALLHPGRKCGKEVFNTSVSEDKRQDIEAVQEENKRYNFFRKYRLSIFYIIRDILWSIGSWKSKELDSYLEKFNADVMFIPIYPYIYMNKLQSYIAKKTGVRGVAYIADDNYSYKPEWYNPMFLLRRFFLKRSIDTLMKYCNELLVILPKLKEEYTGIFDMPINVLTKGIIVEEKFSPKEPRLPLKMVYTGNLFIGRDKSIVEVVKTIERINEKYGKTVLFLDIYSHIQLSSKLEKQLNVPGSATFKGAVPFSQVANVQRKADIVLFVEGTDIFNRNKARLSFSTKLTDYFQAGKCIVAYGSNEIAPIDYLKKNQIALVASKKNELYENMQQLVENPKLINVYGKAAYEFGKENHSNEKMKNILKSSLINAATSK